MKIEFIESTWSPDYRYEKGQVIESGDVKDQRNIPNWLRRGVVVEVKETRKAVTDKETKKAAVRH